MIGSAGHMTDHSVTYHYIGFSRRSVVAIATVSLSVEHSSRRHP